MRFEPSRYPRLPGIYIMKDKSGNVIYVGKAASLRSRLSQYFQKDVPIKTRNLVKSIDDIEFVLTDSGKEALILESNFIKSYRPKYNMSLKDDKHFSFLALTSEQYPRLLVARKNSKGRFNVKAARYFGPFVEGAKRAVSARYLRKLFKVRICRKLPKKECLQYHIGNCDAPCIGKVSQEDYQKNIEALSSVLDGRDSTKQIISFLSGRMQDASKSLDFELASSLRDQIESLKIFFDRQSVDRIGRSSEDFVWFERIGGILHVQILQSRKGVLKKAERFSIPIEEQENPELMFIIQYYDEPPDRIYSNLADSRIRDLDLVFPGVAAKPGRAQKKILEIASNSLKMSKVDPAVLALREELGLTSDPIVIETFDISTLFGGDSVGSMVRFQNGRPDKSGYRRFRIKTVAGQDDFSMMKEVVKRRYSRLASEGSPLPDLILIDGGPGQLHAAISAIASEGIQIPVASLAKKEEEVFLPGRMKPLRLAKTNPALKLLQHCRDEAHRFAVKFHRLRRRKSALE